VSKVLTRLGCAALVLGGSALTVAPATDNKVEAEGIGKLSKTGSRRLQGLRREAGKPQPSCHHLEVEDR
jgi:hypothetical protein